MAEVESLFGSPSPTRCSSPSLALPLPGIQVGATIARTGTPSELPDDNSADLSHPTRSIRSQAYTRVECALPARGSSYTSPILVSDGASSRFMDPETLPQPSNEAIVDSLIKQQDIFPILQSLLDLMSNGSRQHDVRPPPLPPQKTFSGFERNAPKHPRKRRKLTTVPAGAADWDVPYPFQNGEGPSSYITNWEKERGKQLIAQLAELIKSAATKAAVKAHLRAKRNPTYQPKSKRAKQSETIASLLPAPEAFLGLSQENVDALISSLLTEANNQAHTEADTQREAMEASGSLQSTPAPEFNQNMLEDWMSVLLSGGGPTGEFGPPMYMDGVQPAAPSMFLEGASSMASPMGEMDAMIDPVLLTMSAGSVGGSSVPPSVISLSSNSSMAGPPTPSFDGSFQEPQIYNGGSESSYPDEPPRFTTAEKGKGRAVDNTTAVLPTEHVFVSEIAPLVIQTAPFGFPTSAMSFAASYLQPAPATASTQSLSKISRAEVLKRGKEIKADLETELERAKIELWEITIEQGVMVRLGKDATLVG